ncbi:MAG: hypothetical protein AAFP03_06790 [Cyanobacteria bacterium J06598_3]
MKLFTTLNSRLFSGLTPQTKRSGNLVAAIAFSAASVGAISVGLGTVGATAASANVDYYGCTVEMTEAGIAGSDAIAACSSARYPEDLGACVVDINALTGLTSNSALVVCQRSRRPLEVANCTIDIHSSLLESPSTKALQNCGRSLLPERYGNCVVDIAEAAEISTDEALTQCIRAGYRPWQIQPSS